MDDIFKNARVLVIDDEEIVRESFRSILSPRKRDISALMSASADLFGDEEVLPRSPSPMPDFVVDEAINGFIGVEMATLAKANGNPYAVIFVDMRMPGIDGLETVRRIRAVDRQAEIIFVTAYSDHSIEYVASEAGPNVGYHLKPFAPEEIKQVAAKAVYEWNRVRSLERLLELIGSLSVENAHLDTMLNHVLRHVMETIGADAAMVLHGHEKKGFKHIQSVGLMADADATERYGDLFTRLRQQAPENVSSGVKQNGNLLYFSMDQYQIVTVMRSTGNVRLDKLYLVELFTRHAGQALENARLHAELLEKQRLAALGMAVSTIAHDLRNPLATIRGALSLLDPNASPIVAKVKEIISTAADEALGIAEDVLDFAHGRPFSKSIVPVQSIVDLVNERVRHALELSDAQIEWTVDHSPGICINSAKFARALVNLINNAVQACRAHDISAIVKISITRDAEWSRVEVKDNGPGVAAAIRPHIFKAFYTDSKAEGTGLGLAIVRHIAEGHGGYVELVGESGATFLLRIPATT